ncbi:hypothetical protein L6452_31061 [Arctium lappa]|uniref:Uncharacterized protein n=1 Tax=Arctium lappa TaxID=4217 RepID=A0ACB8ZJV6_ARCLA|nr:hypothetical protein L6452_31061 [Arctium lappa]
MTSPSSSSKNSNESKKSNYSHHSMAQKADLDSVDQDHVLTSRMLSFTRHDYHLTQMNNKPNNHFVTLNPSGFPTEVAPLIQLLRNHFLVRALTLKRDDIPESYIQQFWLSARHAKMEKYGHCIIGYATHPSTVKILDLGINHRKLSDVFGLPTKSDLNLRKFSEKSTEEEILEFLRFIGYTVPISKRTNFRRQNLPPLWNVLFSILNRCLTSKVGSPDQSSHTILAILYGIYYDLPLDYAGLIFREIQNAVISKQQDQDRGIEPKNIVFGRFLGLLLGDDLIGEGKLPAEDKIIKLYEMKSHKPTTIKTGYPEARPLSTKMLTYLGSKEDVREYIRENRTPEPCPVTPPRVGFKIGAIVVYLRDEGVRTEVEAAEAKVSKKESPLVRGKGSERKTKKKNKKKRVAEVETPKSLAAEEKATEETAEIRVSEKKKRKLRTLAEKEKILEALKQKRTDLDEYLAARTEPAEGQTKPLQKARRVLVLEESPKDKPQCPIQVASAIAREVSLQYSGGLGETMEMEIDDVTGSSQSEDEEEEPSKKSLEERETKDAFGTPPKPTPCATHTSTPAVLAQRGIETGPHSPNPGQAIRAEDIPSSFVPPSGETKTTSPSKKGDSVALRVHSPQDTSLPHTEVFVTSVTHKSDTQTTSELVVKAHDNSVALEHPQDPFNISLKGVSEPSPKECVDRTSIGASSVKHRGLEGNPPELNIKIGSEGAKDSLAKSGTCVVPEVTSDTFVTKGEFKAFADMVLTKLDELQSSISRESQANSQIIAETLKANNEALQALNTNCTKRADLQTCGQAIIAHSNQIQILGDLCTEEFPKYATQGVQTGVNEMGRLREEIKDITCSVMVPFHTQASTSAPDPSAFATKADLEAIGNQFLQNQNLLRSNFNDQGKKVAADLKKTIATFRFKSDVEINALSLAAEDALQKINKHADEHLCKRKKRKAPATCHEEASQKRAHHDDQDLDASGPGHHEGEKALTPKAPVNSATPLQALPLQRPSLEAHKTHNLMPSASEDPIPSSTIVQGTTSAGSQKEKVSVGSEQIAEGLAKFVEPSSPELMPTAPAPAVQFQSLDPVNAEDTSETSPRKKDQNLSKPDKKNPSEKSSEQKHQEDRVKEIVQSMDAMRVPILRPPPKELKFQENIHTYLYSAEPEAVFLAPNLHPLIKEDIRRHFEQTALERDEVFSTEDIKTVMRISLHSFANKSIMYAKYLVERKDGKQYTFTDADLKNLCAYDLPQL